MIPGTYSVSLYRGDSWGITVKPVNSGGTPIDLTGWTAAAQVRAKPDSTDVLVTMETVVTPASGITVTMTPEDTATLSGSVVWDLQTTDTSGTVRTLVGGTFTMVLDVTRLP